MASFRFVGLAAAFIGGIGLFNSVFTVDQTQQALVLQLGEPKRTIQEPQKAGSTPGHSEL